MPILKQHERYPKLIKKRTFGYLSEQLKLLDLCGLGSGGVFSKALNELIESGFVSQYSPFGKKAKDSLYRHIQQLFRLGMIMEH